MREYTVPAVTEAPTGSLSDPVWANASSHPDTAVFSRRTGSSWTDVTAAEFAQQVTGVAKGLIAAGVNHGDRIALLSPTRYEWTLVDYAIWSIGLGGAPAGPHQRAGSRPLSRKNRSISRLASGPRGSA